MHLRRLTRRHGQGVGQGGCIVVVTVGQAGGALQLGQLVLKHMRRGVHKTCVDGTQLRQLEELAAMLAGLELEGCRLKNGRSACTVVRVQLVPVVEHHGGETLPGLVGVGIRHGCSCFFLLGSFDFGCWCFWFWGWSADFFRRRYCVLLIFSELVLAGGATTHTILM